MRFHRQYGTPTVGRNDVFRIRVWKKRVYVEGWYVEIQIGQRRWLLRPIDKARPVG